MQINTNIQHPTTREYKLILKRGLLAERETIKGQLLDIIKEACDEQKITIEETSDSYEEKIVWYIDTEKHELFKNNDFQIRIKEDKKKNGKLEYDVVFKIRQSHKNSVANYSDLINPAESPLYKFDEYKFEEDIVYPFDSKFAASTKLEYKDLPKLGTFNDVLTVFPQLELKVKKDKKLDTVNRLRIVELSSKLGKILLDGEKKATMEISLWFFDKEYKNPIIGEFDIDVDSKDLSSKEEKKNGLPFNDPVIKEIDQLYKKIQQQREIIDYESTTKTQFVYDFKK